MTSCKEGEGGQVISDNRVKGLGNKCMTEGGGGVKNCPNLRDIIFERPLIKFQANCILGKTKLEEIIFNS